MTKLLMTCFFALNLMACSHGNCRGFEKMRANASQKTTEAEQMNSSKADRVKVYKEDGSLQCGQGKAFSVAEMQKQLKEIKVFSAQNRHDGMMRIQVCGAPTGQSNVYEIERKDLEAALKFGFKEWTLD